MRLDKKYVNSLLKKINDKTDGNWDLKKIKSLSKGVSKKDLKNEDALKDLIKKVGKTLGLKLDKEKIDKVHEKVQKQFPK